ncbi:hypothetical protein [Saccharothrix sp. HUAS TT1]|uniref:hypothetical protein n=1 Tax=unclassified Saccharothrix TaxID=2593673 RepID=UPI00345BCE5C
MELRATALIELLRAAVLAGVVRLARDHAREHALAVVDELARELETDLAAAADLLRTAIRDGLVEQHDDVPPSESKDGPLGHLWRGVRPTDAGLSLLRL